MINWTASLKITGLSAVSIAMLVLSYLFYDKNIPISILLFLAGLFLGIAIVVSEIIFKSHRHEAPWNFDRYKGE